MNCHHAYSLGRAKAIAAFSFARISEEKKKKKKVCISKCCHLCAKDTLKSYWTKAEVRKPSFSRQISLELSSLILSPSLLHGTCTSWYRTECLSRNSKFAPSPTPHFLPPMVVLHVRNLCLSSLM